MKRERGRRRTPRHARPSSHVSVHASAHTHGSVLRIDDLRALARLAADGIAGVTDVVEGVHQSVWSRMGSQQQARTGGLTGLVYRGVRAGIGVAARGTDALLAAAQQALPAQQRGSSPTQREAWLAALNGVLGDHLVATDNPLALQMALRQHGVALADGSEAALHGHGGDVLLMLHGLCMNDLQWRVRTPRGIVDHGAALSAAHGYTVVHVRYNSGLPIAENGLQLAHALERLLRGWPVPVRSVAMLGHSMGGLVARSAVHQAAALQLAWPAQLRHMAFLGTPHHGAPLERAGSAVDRLLAASRHTAPFVRIGMLRSTGITDLREGRVLHGMVAAPPLPDGVACHAIAATTGARPGRLADQVLGDGLVPVDSALGRHAEPARTLEFDPASVLLLRRTGHIGLLSSRAVTRRLLRWLAPAT